MLARSDVDRLHHASDASRSSRRYFSDPDQQYGGTRKMWLCSRGRIGARDGIPVVVTPTEANVQLDRAKPTPAAQQ